MSAQDRDRHMTDEHGQPFCGEPLRAVRHTTAFAGNVTCEECADALADLHDPLCPLCRRGGCGCGFED